MNNKLLLSNQLKSLKLKLLNLVLLLMSKDLFKLFQTNLRILVKNKSLKNFPEDLKPKHNKISHKMNRKCKNNYKNKNRNKRQKNQQFT